MTSAVLPHRGLAALPLLRVLHGLGLALFTAFVFFACFAFSEASPYDLVALPTIALWLLLGIRLHRGAVPLVILLTVFVGATVLALLPYLDEERPVTWTVQLCYLAVTTLFFAMFFADETERRVELALKVYTASTLFSGALGIGGYLDLIGNEDLFSKYGRASGTFQDPNVFGSFLTLGALYLMHNLMTGRARRPLLSLAGLLLLLAGIFLSFSRGSWGGTVVAVALMVSSIYRTSASMALRRRILRSTLVTLVLGGLALGGLLSIGSVAETFHKRAAVTQDYDEGETGRFGNQMRGFGLLMEEPMGFGPLRWRLIFNLEPHNSYLGAFANGGWVAGAAFILLVLSTARVGWRLMAEASPVRRHAQIVVPVLIMFFLQGFQIDIEKWRHVHMMLGLVWALEAARVRSRGGGAVSSRVQMV
ncbi:O-antigen ligase family protein [Methylobacterium sp. WSM2598]|uniref:O-antigen ligase family protein n=1 Tax=Methylobacterium sp. WSM2598 TaxID=398261 RepID=UPI00036BD459|nr:O-antigen ligase family protein [Methylobacterium sp. WSM2598]